MSPKVSEMVEGLIARDQVVQKSWSGSGPIGHSSLRNRSGVALSICAVALPAEPMALGRGRPDPEMGKLGHLGGCVCRWVELWGLGPPT